MKKAISWFFTILFLLFAVVQYNDPDPYLWIPIYLLVAFLCFRIQKFATDKFSYFIFGLIFLLWAINQFPSQWEGLQLDSLNMKKNIFIELGRESLGLGCCTLALWVCASLK